MRRRGYTECGKRRDGGRRRTSILKFELGENKGCVRVGTKTEWTQHPRADWTEGGDCRKDEKKEGKDTRALRTGTGKNKQALIGYKLGKLQNDQNKSRGMDVNKTNQKDKSREEGRYECTKTNKATAA